MVTSASVWWCRIAKIILTETWKTYFWRWNSFESRQEGTRQNYRLLQRFEQANLGNNYDLEWIVEAKHKKRRRNQARKGAKGYQFVKVSACADKYGTKVWCQ